MSLYAGYFVPRDVDPYGERWGRLDPSQPLPPRIPKDYPRNEDGEPVVPLNPNHPDWLTPIPDEHTPGSPTLPTPGNRGRDKTEGDGGGCTCKFGRINRQRPPDENGDWPTAGLLPKSCKVGTVRTFVYHGSCSGGPCCSRKTCGEVTTWTCKRNTTTGRTSYRAVTYGFGCQL